ncbi:hypothetical protein L596_011510 [Steinernema carpocapsae]|uniref:Uncharacterized protein n=1 Tax=Steinernema carpocapsae TaxID=34508 RepID=A0A4U5NV18_STECR|nr:hypothetical protein L596_011510 [Steinernema carpocapsae]
MMGYYSSALPNFRNSENAIIVISSAALASLLLNALTLISVFNVKSKALNSHAPNVQKIELKLFVASLSIFIFELAMVAFQVSFTPWIHMHISASRCSSFSTFKMNVSWRSCLPCTHLSTIFVCSLRLGSFWPQVAKFGSTWAILNASLLPAKRRVRRDWMLRFNLLSSA